MLQRSPGDLRRRSGSSALSAIPLSLDLRRRIVVAARTQPQKEVARRFDVGLATVQRLLQRERAGASPAPADPPASSAPSTRPLSPVGSGRTPQ